MIQGRIADGLLNHFFSFRQQHNPASNQLLLFYDVKREAIRLLLLSSLAGLGATELGGGNGGLDLAGGLLDGGSALDGLHVQVRAVALLGGAGDGVVDELARRGGGLEGDLLVGLAGLVPVVAELGDDLDLVVLGVDANGLGVGERRVLICANLDQHGDRDGKNWWIVSLPCASGGWSG